MNDLPDDLFQEKLRLSARAAALADVREGTRRNGYNAMLSIQWSINVREAHKDCGRLKQRKDGGVRCPKHGVVEPPEYVSEEDWEEPDV